MSGYYYLVRTRWPCRVDRTIRSSKGAPFDTSAVVGVSRFVSVRTCQQRCVVQVLLQTYTRYLRLDGNLGGS